MKKNKLKIENCKLKIGDFRRGMTYVELIVVLSIFATMTSIVLFNYDVFQAKVDIKNLASDIALKVVEAQKASLFGESPSPFRVTAPTWKPSYGMYFTTEGTDSSDGIPFNKKLIYFADLNQDGDFDNNLTCAGNDTDECLDKVTITQGGNFISNITVIGEGEGPCLEITSLSVVFKRPNSSANIKTNQLDCTAISSAEITVSSPGTNPTSAIIKIYPSGRIQID